MLVLPFTSSLTPDDTIKRSSSTATDLASGSTKGWDVTEVAAARGRE